MFFDVLHVVDVVLVVKVDFKCVEMFFFVQVKISIAETPVDNQVQTISEIQRSVHSSKFFLEWGINTITFFWLIINKNNFTSLSKDLLKSKFCPSFCIPLNISYTETSLF